MPSIGKDLQKIRTHLDYTIQDIQQFTKIPVSTLQTIENDTIFERSAEGTTYIRSFIRSYGRSLQIDDDTLIKALDQQANGNYSNLLLQSFPGLNPSAPADDPIPEVDNRTEQEVDGIEAESETVTENQPPRELFNQESERSSSEKPESQPEEKKQVLSEAPNISSKASEDAGEIVTTETPANEPSPAKNSAEPSIKSVNWADLGNKAHTQKKKSSVWIFGIIILLAIAAAAVYMMYDNEMFSFGNVQESDQSITEYQSSPGGVSLDLSNNGQSAENEPIEEQPAAPVSSDLDEVLFITVYAAYDVADPVRVWSDLKPRLDPYWLEQGMALNFEFQDTIRIRGPYSNMLLFKNGHRISDFQEYYIEEENYVELTRDYFNSDAKWINSVPFDLPAGVSAPESVENRPTF
ncbi:MAG: helix-turn-helix domain-containing protein [Balneolaceae bacterium]|nr:helix-turn-helix domain-containing protein [Balneolaceae bacterium]